MYDRPEMRSAWDSFWIATVREYRRLIPHSTVEPPETLTRDVEGLQHWQDPELFLSQTCSLPYRTQLHGVVTLLGAFDFGLPGCPAGYYNSVFVMRADDPRSAPQDWPELTLAYNAPDSQSGWAAPIFHAQSLGASFGAGIETGAHASSARLVAEGKADIAALDAQTLRLLRQYEPLMDKLVEVAQTETTPGLPLITANTMDAPAVWDALIGGFDTLSAEMRAMLGIRKLVAISRDDYLAQPVPPAPHEVWGI